MPEEIANDRPDRLRAAFVLQANPLRSYADTTAYEEAFGRLDLLVVAEIAMSETATLAHYVLPCRSTHESWSPADAIIPSKTKEGFLDVVSRMCRPVVEVEGEQKEAGEIYTLLVDAMGLTPTLPDSLYQAAASGSLRTYRDALMGYVMEHPENMMKVPFIAAKTLGNAIGSAHLASYFTGFLQRSPAKQEEAARVGFDTGPDQGLALYQAIIDKPEGMLVGVQEVGKNLGRVATKDGRIRLHTAEAKDWIKEIDPSEEEKRLQADAEFPLILMAGRHMDMNANTGMRDPAWNEGRRPCTLAMNPADAEKYGFSDGQMVKVITEAGEERIEVEVTEDARKGQVIIPHGFGLVYNGVKFGANVNRLAKNTNRDQFGTPMHRYIQCKVEAV
jgi:anaerobic selenocysteine-containing dehydrogenase